MHHAMRQVSHYTMVIASRGRDVLLPKRKSKRNPMSYQGLHTAPREVVYVRSQPRQELMRKN